MSGWTTVQLGEVSDFVRGVTFKPTDVVEAGTDGSVPCMRTKNVQLDLDLSDVWWIDRSHVKRDEQYLNEGDLLISSANSWNLVGKCSWIPSLESPSTFGGFVTALRAKPQQVDPRYLYRFFSSARVQATVRSFARQTTNISNLDLKRCAALPIPLPSVEEQRRIAAILDHADTLRAKRREALARLDELTQSIFIDMFGDPAFSVKGANAVTIGDLLDSAQYGTSEKSGAEGEYAVLRMNNITYQGQMDLTDLKYTDLPDDKVDRFTVRAGDVLRAP
ncbi:type I restriction modification DNA specificity protein [Rhodococcus sp. SMB37]|uniref:restriction endonuclease subunit S n=1 Tax=Rhodococcus sp. SMB37 TaxID=2512213 RepID=UPI0010502BB4|nr:restriction endonuclease subunit S [Rhodococcus sp. SMB37]TCN52343.1 type I restriction modification DNA specificity protein [Rhodococcus sp. SMB37]